MEQLVVIGTSPAHDVSVVVGPFRSPDRAEQASQDLTAKGYNTETCPLVGGADIDAVELSAAWD